MNTICGFPIASLFNSPAENSLFDNFVNPSNNPLGRFNDNEANTYEKENANRLLDELSKKVLNDGFSHLISIPSSKEYVSRYADYLSSTLNVNHIKPLSKIDAFKSRGASDRDQEQNLCCEDHIVAADGIFLFDGLIAEGVTIKNAIDVLSKSTITYSKISVICLFDYREYLQNRKPLISHLPN